MRVMDRILIILGTSAALFIVTALVFSWLGKTIPDSLIYSFFSAIGAEGFIMGWIKNSKGVTKDD